MSSIGAELEQDRQATLKRIAELPQLASANPQILDPPGPYTKRLEEFQNRAAAALGESYAQRLTERRFQNAISWTRRNAAHAYQDRGMKKIREGAVGLTWPVKLAKPPAEKTGAP